MDAYGYVGFMTSEMTAADLYARLRKVGETYLAADQANLIAGARRLAKADNLRIMQSRTRATRGMSPSQIRNRMITVSLTDKMGTTIVAPGAEQD